MLTQAAQLVASGAELKRVTILAAHPDSTVVVQADYFLRQEYAAAGSGLPEDQQLVSELVESLRATDLPIAYRCRNSVATTVDNAIPWCTL